MTPRARLQAYVARYRALRASTSGQAGFTIPELLVAVIVTALVAAAIGAVIIGSMSLVTRMQVNTSTQASAQTVMQTFQSELRDAARVVAADANSITFDYKRDTACERHIYTMQTDDTYAGREQLRHQITVVPLPAGSTCADVATLLASRVTAGTYNTNRVELNNLGISSGFTYQNTVGQTITPPFTATACAARPGYESRPSYMDFGSVLMLADTQVATSDTANISAFDQVRAALRSNTMGLSCN